ncbi:HAMP domain-containing protein [Rhodobacterales bacterium HKCCE3408]|nr:HAMP domain-containing protein [Rhodobacterales bacterium HKCCE3408]
MTHKPTRAQLYPGRTTMLTRLTQSRISLRLPLAMCLLFGVMLSGIGVTLYHQARALQTEAAIATMREVEEQTVRQIAAWFDRSAARLVAAASDPIVTRQLARTARALTSGAVTSDDIRRAYVLENPNPLPDRDLLVEDGENTPYSRAHRDVHRFFRNWNATDPYYDIFFIDRDGLVIYSFEKEDDFGSDLRAGPYSSSALATLFSEAVDADPGEIASVDFRPYAPSGGAPAAFLATPVFDESGLRIGVLAVQLSATILSELTLAPPQLGAWGDLFIVGPDGLARTQSRHADQFDAFDPVGDLNYLEAATTGEALIEENVMGRLARPVAVRVAPLDTPLGRWAVVAEIDRAEFFAPLSRLRLDVITFVGVGLLLSVGLSLLLSRSITGPLAELMGSVDSIAGGRLDVDIPIAKRRDEPGEIGRNLVALRDRLKESERVNAKVDANREAQAKVVDRLRTGLKAFADGDLTGMIDEPFDEAYEGLRHDFNGAVDRMNRLLGTIVENAAEILTRTEEIGASSEDLSHRTENQAATLEETAAAIDELTGNAKSAAGNVSEVEGVVRDTRVGAEQSGKVVQDAIDAMSAIKRSSDEISQIIGVIDDISFQTNLLALNAGVEAARAGEAGRGFAVVASEVRALAQRSSEAARQIKELIVTSTGQVDTGVALVNSAGEALSTIVGQVSSISGLTADLATGANRQSAGIAEINSGAGQLDQVTQENAAMVEQLTAAVATLRQEARSLRQRIAMFRLREAEGLDVRIPTPAVGMGSQLASGPASSPGVEQTSKSESRGAGNAGRSHDLAAVKTSTKMMDQIAEPMQSAAVGGALKPPATNEKPGTLQAGRLRPVRTDRAANDGWQDF